MGAYISLGSNMHEPLEMLKKYTSCLGNLPDLHDIRSSPVYMTEPQGFLDQPWFANKVIKVTVDNRIWTPFNFLEALLDIEKRLGRIRSDNPTLRFGPRKIDSDLLLYGDMVIESPACTIPHPRMLERAFVLVPLSNMDDSLIISGKSVGYWLSRLSYHIDGNKIYQQEKIC